MNTNGCFSRAKYNTSFNKSIEQFKWNNGIVSSVNPYLEMPTSALALIIIELWDMRFVYFLSGLT